MGVTLGVLAVVDRNGLSHQMRESRAMSKVIEAKVEAHQIATAEAVSVKASGGGGFGFECKVAAAYLAYMLGGRRPLGSNCPPISAVQFQTQESGWIFNDILLDLGGGADQRFFAISSKSNRQVTQGGFSKDFVNQAWGQWSTNGTSPFRRNTDLLGLATGRLSNEVKNAFDGMVAQAQKADWARTVKRFTSKRVSSEIQRKLFSTLKCPSRGFSKNEELLQRCQLLSCLRVMHFDFDSVPSSAEEGVIEYCRSLLQNNNYSHAVDLWNCLCRLADEYRHAGGTLDLSSLLRLLKRDFGLVGHPDYLADWNRLMEVATDLISDIRCDIGQQVCLLRPDRLQNISKCLESHSIVVLLGEPGCGKSSLMKQAAHRLRDSQVLWLNDYVLEGGTLKEVESRLGLKNSLVKLFQTTSHASPVLMVDGVNRFSGAAIDNLGKLLEAADFRQHSGHWKLVVSCQLDKWQDIAPSLLAKVVVGTQVPTITLQQPTLKEVASISSACPNLQPFASRQELGELLRSFTVIDRVVSASQTNGVALDTTSWSGLSDLILWLWKVWITDGDDHFARAQLLTKHCSMLQSTR